MTYSSKNTSGMKTEPNIKTEPNALKEVRASNGNRQGHLVDEEVKEVGSESFSKSFSKVYLGYHSEYLQKITTGSVEYIALVDQNDMHKNAQREVEVETGKEIHLDVVFSTLELERVNKEKETTKDGLVKQAAENAPPIPYILSNNEKSTLIRVTSGNNKSAGDFLTHNEKILHKYIGSKRDFTKQKDRSFVRSLLQEQVKYDLDGLPLGDIGHNDHNILRADEILRNSPILVYKFATYKNGLENSPSQVKQSNQTVFPTMVVSVMILAILGFLAYYYGLLQRLLRKLRSFFLENKEENLSPANEL